VGFENSYVRRETMSRFKIAYEEGFRTTVTSEQGQVFFQTDAPKEHGGKGEFMSPTDLLAVSLGSCVLTIMGIFAKKLHLPFHDVTVDVEKKPNPTGGIGEIVLHVYYPHAIDPEGREKLEKAAKNCPIHHIIDPKITQQMHFHYTL
jgi:putative redox protein